MRPQPRGTEEDGEGGGSWASAAAKLSGAAKAETRPGAASGSPASVPSGTHAPSRRRRGAAATGRGPPSGRGVVQGRGAAARVAGIGVGERPPQVPGAGASSMRPPRREQCGMAPLLGLVLFAHL